MAEFEEQDLPEGAEPVRERIRELPDPCYDCEGCGGEGTMLIRRSSLNMSANADDIMLKCSNCHCVRTHGLGLSPDEFDAALDQRLDNFGSRVIDVYTHASRIDAPSDDVNELLEALGYVPE